MLWKVCGRQCLLHSVVGSNAFSDQESDMDPHRDGPEGLNAQQHFGNLFAPNYKNNLDELHLGKTSVGQRGDANFLARKHCSNTSPGELPLDPQLNPVVPQMANYDTSYLLFASFQLY